MQTMILGLHNDPKLGKAVAQILTEVGVTAELRSQLNENGVDRIGLVLDLNAQESSDQMMLVITTHADIGSDQLGQLLELLDLSHSEQMWHFRSNLDPFAADPVSPTKGVNGANGAARCESE